MTDLTTGAEKIYKIDIGFREDTPFGADFDSPHGNLPLRKIAGKLLQFLNFQVRETSQAITQTGQRYIVTGKVPKTASTRLDVNIGSLSLVTLGKVLPKIIFTLGTVTPAGTVSRVGDYTIGWEKPRGGASHPTPPLPSKATLNKPYGASPPGDVFKLLELLEFKVTSFATPARGPKTTVASITCTLKSKIHCE